MTLLLVAFFTALGVAAATLAGNLLTHLGDDVQRRVDHTFDRSDRPLWFAGLGLLALALLVHSGALWWVMR